MSFGNSRVQMRPVKMLLKPNYINRFAKTVLIMKLVILLTAVACLQVSASVHSQAISIHVKNESFKKVMEDVSRQSGYPVFTDARILNKGKNVTISVDGGELNNVLSEIFSVQPLTYSIINKTIVIRDRITAAFYPIRGVVLNERGEPVSGASVSVRGSTSGTVTNAHGEFTVDVKSPRDSLVITFVGYVTQTVAAGSSVYITVILQPNVERQSLDEVVIVGYGKQRKATVTGAIAQIGTKELIQSPQANISNSLVGRLPGLLAVQRSGQPGEDQTTLRIRGVGTFAGSSDPLVLVDGIEGVNYNSIDPNEIENLSILKDASATAVFGVRGANGVIIITTKRGNVGKPQISFTSNYAITQFTEMRNTVSAYDYVKGYNEALKYDSYITGGYTQKFSDADIEKFRTREDLLFYPDVNWTKEMFAPTSPQMQYNLTFSGGVKGVKYFASAGYFDQTGQFSDKVVNAIKEYNAQPRFKRYNFRSNFDFDITKNLSAVLNISSQTEVRLGNISNINRTLELATKASPIWSPGLWEDKLIYLENGPSGIATPIDQLLRSGYSRGYRNYLNALVRLNYKLDIITKGLSTHGTISYINMNSQDAFFPNIKIAHIPKRLPDGSVVFVPQSEESPIYFNESVNKYRREYGEFGFDYASNFGKHNVGGLLLYNQSKLYDPGLPFLIPQGYQGLVGRATYDFDGRYMLEYNIGYNGTENFAPGKRFGFFPAYSLGWVVSKDPYFPENKILSYLKIRGSYGEVGNDKVGGDRFLYLPSSYYYGNQYNFGTVGVNFNLYPVANEGKIGNPDVTWERAKKMNVGAEINFWKDKVKVVADYFKEKRDNILASLGTVPIIVGATLPAYNLGKMKNSGFDGEISFNNNFRSLNYWLKANYTYARNIIEFMDEPEPLYSYQSRTGKPFGQNFGMIADGFYNTWEEINDPNRPVSSWNSNKIQPGDLKYVDVNGDGILNSDDMVPIGYSNFPEKIFGISFGGNIKGLDFSVLFQGADNVSVVYSRHSRYGYREDATVPFYILEKSWTQERYDQGLRIEFPHLSVGDDIQKHNYTTSNFWVRDASYVRLKNAEIGYTFRTGFLSRIGLNSARIFANGNNLITWSDMLPGVDPESNVAQTNWEPYPLVRVYNFGLNIKF